MAETNLNVFTNGVASYLSSCIFPSIVQGFAAKGVATSVDELLAMTNTPATRSPATPFVPTPTVPTMAFGGAVPAMAPAIAPTANRKTTATTAPVTGRTCAYQFKRGENKGKFCGKATAPGTEYCNACLKTRKNLTKDMAAGTIPGAAPTMGAIPGMGGLPPGYNAPVAAIPPANGGAAQAGQLSVVPYDEARGLFREPNHNFIVYEVSPGVIAVIGKLNEAENKIVPLTAQEQVTAQNIGLVLGTTEATQPTTQAATPTMAPIPVAAVPAIPTAMHGTPAHNTPTVPAIPTAIIQPHAFNNVQQGLPVIAPLAAPTQMQAAAVPNIPAIPQLNA
jgi:hypothetical protein